MKSAAITKGKYLKERWGVNVRHALFSKKGDWYHRLERFPAALFDTRGYVRFVTQGEYSSSPYLQIRQHIHVPIRISQMPGYVQVIGFRARRRRSTRILASKRLLLALVRARANFRVPGAGFGTPQQNRQVERVACAAIRAYFRRRGYTVRSREKEKLGYDFDVRRQHEVLHVEVKGVSGAKLRFPVTANEIRCASIDPRFHVAVVASARTRARKIYLFDAKRFLENFAFSALAFFAEYSGPRPAGR
ncbi:MAG: 5-methylcytosine-specific restriction enzyme [Verrucomicrobiota bacterium]|jgi:hypothetical protein